MGIHEDAADGTLNAVKISAYLKSDPDILKTKSPSTGYTPLGAAAAAGQADVVSDLLRKGAKADDPSRDGETPLLLAASKNRSSVVQLLLKKTPADSVDATTTAYRDNTPLMYAVKVQNVDVVRLLRRAGASLTVTNKDGDTAKAIAEANGNRDVLKALDPNEETKMGTIISLVVSFLQYIVYWVNKNVGGPVRRIFGYEGEFKKQFDEVVSPDPGNGADIEPNEFVENVENYTKDKFFSRFFGDNKDFITQFAQNAVNLKNNPDTSLGSQDLLPKTIKVSLHKQVIYCDDSSSMRRDNRWEAQKNLVIRIAKITTMILPEGEGVALRFINQNVDESPNFTLKQIEKTIGAMSWQPGGNTEIGTYLKSKILEPMVYAKLNPPVLERPLLVSIITDGMPDPEKPNTFVDAIIECGTKLEAAGYRRESVRFLIGQVGTARNATGFLESLRDNKAIEQVVYVTTDRLDEKLASFRQNENELDRWLIETLFSPIKDRAIEQQDCYADAVYFRSLVDR